MPSIFARPNKFNLSHTNILTCEMGALVPFFKQEVLPGDEFRIKTEAIVRLAPMLAPIFGEVDLYTHYFFVPNRLLWSNWEKFITNGLEAGTTSVVPPYISPGTNYPYNSATTGVGSLFDFLGYPVGDLAGTSGGSPVPVCSWVSGARYSCLPLRAYNKIYNDWYRPEFLESAVPENVGDGATSFSDYSLKYRCWRRDLFTSSNPFVQLGSPVTLGLGTSAPVWGDGTTVNWTDGTNVAGTRFQSGQDVGLTTGIAGVDVGDSATPAGTFIDNVGTGIIQKNTTQGSGMYADLSSATAVTINDLRTAFQLQRILERKARSGNRYVEYLASTFGVRSADARLQRSEFLGGGKSPIMISEVLQTSAGTSTSPQGNMAGHGFGASRTFAVNKAFTEHGYVLGILSIMPRASYFQGRPKELCRWSWTDYAQPEFYHLGESPIYKSELVANSSTLATNSFDNGDIFGYQPRYEEYRRKPSEVHGDFRTNMAYWHLARAFASVPTLNADFVHCNPSKRIFAAGNQAVRPCWVQMFINFKAIRPLSKKGAPGMVDH